MAEALEVLIEALYSFRKEPGAQQGESDVTNSAKTHTHPWRLPAASVTALPPPLRYYNPTGLIPSQGLRLISLKQIYATDILQTDMLNEPNRNLFTLTIYLS